MILKNRPVVYGTLILVAILLVFPALEVLPYFKPSASSVKLELVGPTAAVRFNLSSGDKSRLLALAEKLNLSWRGEDLAMSLEASSSAQLQGWLPASLGLWVPSASEVELTGTTDQLPSGSIGPTGEAEEFLPDDTIMVARVRHLQDHYQLPGKEVFAQTEAKGTLGVSLTDSGLGMTFIIKVKNEKGLESVLSTLKNVPVQVAPGYSGQEGVAAGFSQSTFEGVSTYTLTQPGLAYQPTFGILRGYLVIGSTPEIWQKVKKTLGSGGGIRTDHHYMVARGKVPNFSVGFLYLNLSEIAKRGASKIVSDTAPLFKLDLTGELLNSGLAGDKLDTLTATWLGIGISPSVATPSRVLVRLITE